jgi:hypothetical protein
LQDPISKNPSQERAGGVAQGEGLEFKPEHCKKRIFIYLFIFHLAWDLTQDFVHNGQVLSH